MQNRRMATIVTWALYLSTAICWQEPELLFGTLFTLAVSRNDRFLHASFPSLIQTFRLPATTYINFLSLPILHFLPRPLFLYSDSYTSKAKAATQYNHSESVTSINSPVSFQNKTKMADIHVYAWNRWRPDMNWLYMRGGEVGWNYRRETMAIGSVVLVLNYGCWGEYVDLRGTR